MALSFSVREIADWVQGRVVNGGAIGDRVDAIRVQRMAPLGTTREGDIAFFFSRSYMNEVPGSTPGILVTGEDFVKPLEAAKLPLWSKTAVIACKDPYLGLATVSRKFAEEQSTIAHVKPVSKGGIHPTAVVHDSARIGANVSIGPYCVIEEGAMIGDGTELYPSCYIGPRVMIGAQTVLFPGVKVYENCVIGARVRIHAGVVVGADGFGYAPQIENGKPVGHRKIYHLGKVVIGDDVEIGANACIDRGTIADTRIDSMAKIDNLVQVGHNAHVGEGAIICGDTALAGSSSVGKYAYVGGVSGISNQVHVGDGAKVGAATLVTKDVPPGGTAVGNPQREHKEFFRIHAILSKMLEERASRRTKREES